MKKSNAIIYSAFPMDSSMVATLKPTIDKLFNQDLDYNVILDEKLIGGIRVVSGDNVLDYSVNEYLNRLQAALGE